MKNSIQNDFWLYIVLSVVFVLSVTFSFRENVSSWFTEKLEAPVYTQPSLPTGAYPWAVRSIDTQVISKHWPDVTEGAIEEQVGLLKELGVNYIAIGTPYDRVDEMQMWADEIHDAGLNVWFRSHWTSWEGDDGQPAVMKSDEYLRLTGEFIRNNPTLFAEGDSFTVAVEAEQVGIGFGKRFLTWDAYRQFLKDEISVSNEAFTDIGLKNKVHTNWLSVNGWVVDNQFTQELVDNIGLIVVDHFVAQSPTIGEEDDTEALVRATIEDLDRFHDRWGVPVLLGEWGYQIYQPVSNEKQAEVVERMFEELRKKDYLVGVNYWTHMGNSASIIGDEFGSNLEYKDAASIIENYYNPASFDLIIPAPSE